MDELHDVQASGTYDADRETKARKRRFVRPPVDVYSTSAETVVVADMPGVRKADLEISVEGDDLVIEAPVAGRMERESALPWGYHRRFRLRSAFDRDRIGARYEDGILVITLPKVAAEVKRVEID